MGTNNYQISLNRYRELKAFCRQYREYQSELKIAEKMIFSDGEDVTSKTAVRIRDLRYAIDLIEKTAMDTAPMYYDLILKAVTEDVSIKRLSLEIERGEFVDVIHKFYYLLSTRKGV